jgi:hypothetical protein
VANKKSSPPKYVRRIVNFERCDYDLVKQVAKKRGLGNRGFSAAVRMILREWSELQPPPGLLSQYPPAPQPPSYYITD